jgi:hypothetical protein
MQGDTMTPQTIESLVAREVHKVAGRETFLTTKEAAGVLSMSPITLAVRRRAGNGPPHLGKGKLIRYQHSTLVQWLKDQGRK